MKKNNFSKILVMFLFSFVLVLGSSFQALANEMVIQVGNQKGKAGEEVVVPVEVHSGEEVGGFQLGIYYDSDAMEFVDLERGEMIRRGGFFDYNHLENEKKIIVVYVTMDTIKADGVIVNLTFRLKKDFTGELPIAMDPPEVVDGEDGVTTLPAEVSGVSEEFQQKIAPDVKIAESSGQSETGSKKQPNDSQNDQDSQENQGDQNSQNGQNGQQEADGQTEQQGSDSDDGTSKDQTGDKESSSSNKEQDEGKGKSETSSGNQSKSAGGPLGWIVGLVVLSAAAAGTILFRKRKNQTQKAKREEGKNDEKE